MLGMMDEHPSPSINSFVIRFVVEAAPVETGAAPDARGHSPAPTNSASLSASSAASYRGSIRHIQTEEELNFNAWADAVAFITRFVPIHNGLDKTER